MAGDALPTNPNVASGDVSVATSGSAMTISQGSDRAIVNWQGFSIGEGNTVNIHQPGVTSAILNRVTGSTSSTIAGALNANGQVLLINPNGIAITSTGAVTVGGGFVGSTLDILDEDFLKGDLTFKGKGASASITNEGVITVGSGGYAALLGGSVRNDGRIAVPLGKVGLGAGERITLDLSGDGFMQVALPSSGKDSLQALVDNGGTLSADGGYVILAAATAQELARKAINMDGLIQARTVSGQNGAIVLGGGAGGTTTVSGTLDASGVTGTGGTGGSIAVTGQTVALTGATLDASGTRGGGAIRVGGDWHGKGPLPTAKTTTVDPATSLKADATVEGDGGSVVLWSDKQTTVQGAISARGAGAGKGGDAEVSGKAKLTYQGFADLSSDKGAFGTLLLDPYDVTISNGTDTSGVTASGDDSVINVSTLQTALALASVTVSTGTGGAQNGDITLANALSWSANTTLTLAAAGAIAIDANLTASGTKAGLVLTTGTGKDYSIASGASITLSGSGATLAINGTDYTLIHDMAALDNIDTTGLSRAYALAGNLDASGPAYDHALVGADSTSGFAGTFAGLGHTITDLTIEKAVTHSQYWGLFGANHGTIRDIGLVGGSVTGTGTSTPFAGALVGYNTGSIANAYATAAVTISTTGTLAYSYAGGLVGYNNSTGTITNAYATGDVTASSGAYAYAGGLVGYNNEGTITNTHATGAVSASSSGGGSSRAYAGGLVGDNFGPITNAYATGSVTASNGNFAFAGGLVGYSGSFGFGTITNVYATGNVLASNSSEAYAGGLLGYNTGTITNANATGAVSTSVSGASNAGGLVGSNTGTITNAIAAGNVSASVFGTGISLAGGLVGSNTGTTTNANATGSVSTSVSGDGIIYAGGLVGYSQSGTITNATASGNVSASFSGDGITSANNLAGGLVGSNTGTITNATATGNVSASVPVSVSSGGLVYEVGIAGGLVGSNAGTISNAAATGAVSAETGTGNAYAGGFVGFTAGGSITNSYATGAASAETGTGDAYAGGLVGYHDSGTFVASYWDTTTSGLMTGVGSGTTSGVTGLTTAQFQDTDSFMTLASLAGWDFDTTWAPPSSGYYPQLYALTPVLYVQANDVTMTYGDSVASPSLSATHGGPDSYVFGRKGDTVTPTYAATSSTSVGTYVISQTAVSSKGVSYRVIASGGTLTIDPRAITVTADNRSRSYGDANPTLTYGVTSGSLVNGDSLSGALTTTATTASNVGTYGITQGTLAASSNYSLTYAPGTLTVSARAITVSANDQSRTYGDANPTLTYGVTSGSLVNGDSLSGALATTATSTSTVGTYGIAQGTLAASSNYNLTYTPGVLTVMARPTSATPQVPISSPSTVSTSSTPVVLITLSPASTIADAPFANAPNPVGHLQEQEVSFGETGEGGGNTPTTVDQRLDGAVCFMGAGQTLSCGAS
jgi:filamentous hemagglutinin family protein